MIVQSSILRTPPEAQGISSAAILRFVEAVETRLSHLHSFMLLRNGCVVAEGWWFPYEANGSHNLYSLSKSFTSTAIGLAVFEGRLSVEDPVLSFFPADAPKKVSDNLAAMRIRHLLTMSTGHGKDTLAFLPLRKDGNWVKAFLARPVRYPPGTHFVYNNGATFMLSAILQKVTGEKMVDYLTPRLFKPLGIQAATWDENPRGVTLGFMGLSCTTEGIARLGQLYLQKGVWEGKRILQEAWAEAATRKQVSNDREKFIDWQQGYGYQFWRCRHNAYRGDGAFGQYCIVMPDQHAVLAMTGGLGEMQPPLDLVWEHLLPAMQPHELPADPEHQAVLTQKLASLQLPVE